MNVNLNLSLRQVRRLKDKTQEEIAQLLNVHVQTYRKLEENPEFITIGQAKKIADYLGISYNEIFFADNIYQKLIEERGTNDNQAEDTR